MYVLSFESVGHNSYFHINVNANERVSAGVTIGCFILVNVIV